jgi:hypothetical protein
MAEQQRWVTALGTVAVLWLATLAGCGGNADLGIVAGVVTLDGQPLANATVEFIPTDGSETRTSYDGTTDESGRYKLYFSAGHEGAAPGAYTVHIWPPGPNDESPVRPAVQLPPQYNARSELSATVAAGKNSIDFPLATSSGTLRR